MELGTQIIVLGFLVEATVDTIKLVIQDGAVNRAQILSLIVGIGIALATNTDIFEVINVASQVDIVGVILSGVLMSRGANFVHDLMDRIGGGSNE